MEQNLRTLNILLTVSLVPFIVPLILIRYKIVNVPENLEIPIILIAMLFGLLYCVFLGILASKKNRSVIKWVGLTIVFSPFGHIVSYPLMLAAKSMEKKE
jgi:hypothetical protein